MEPLPLQAMPNEGSLQHPLLPTEGQVELSLSSWPSCWAVLPKALARILDGLSPREEEGNGLTCCAAEGLELAAKPLTEFGGPKRTSLLA